MDLRDRKVALAAAVDDLLRVVPYAHAFAQVREGTAFRATTRATAIEPLDPVCGVVLSAWNGETMLEVSVPSLDDDAVKGATARLRDLITRQGSRTGPAIDPGAPLERDFAVAEHIPVSSLSLEERLARVQAIKDRVHALDARVKNAVARATHVRTQEIFVGPTRRLFQDLRRAEMVCLVVMEQGGHAADLHGGRGRQGGAEHLTLADDDVAHLVEDCARMLGAERAPGGSYRCVFDGDVAGLLAHEAFGHGTEADMFVKRRAKGAGYLGKQVGSELVDMYDDPSLPGEAASYFFDHEGHLAAPTRIIERGVLLAPLTDLVSATYLGMARTANGRRESVQRKAYTRMSNTFFGKGGDRHDALVASLDDGLLVRHARNGMEDPKGWGIQCEAYLAEEIKGGKRTGRVFSPVIITGYVPDLLTSIDGVSDAVEIGGLGMCGKGYKEWVKVTDGGPSLRLTARIA
ncbi:MAG: TldD/PmbA family protein [Deltaproteobacteria bacterium]|nr:TldD/PmbA family protein [Deltaproteobacteria bacterium]